jgi:hypothetical protein
MANGGAVMRRTGVVRVVVSLALAVPVAGCADGGGSAATAWDTFLEAFVEDALRARPSLAVWAGRHEYDGQLPDWSRTGIMAEIDRLERARAGALAFSDASLDQGRRNQRDYMIARIDHDLFWLRDARWPFRNPLFYNFPPLGMGGIDPNVYLMRDYAPLAERMAAYVRYAREVPRVAADLRANLDIPMPRTYADLGAQMFGGLAVFLREAVPDVFAEVADTTFYESNAAAAEAMQELAEWFDEQRGQATDGFALGEDQFRTMLLMTEGMDTPLAEIEEVGRREMDRNAEALHEACGVFAPSLSVSACMARANANKPPDGPLAAARRQLEELHAFIAENDLVTIPEGQVPPVVESPPYMRRSPAQIDVPGPFEAGSDATYYVSLPDPTWSEADQLAFVRSEALLLVISAHEVWPGHVLQFLHLRRAGDPLAQLFPSYAFVEGWGTYVEEMIWEAGIRDGDPEVRIAYLVGALVRNARLLCAIGLHTGSMTLDECERLFREQAFLDAISARQEATRGTFDPAYLNYTLGSLLIRRLRDDWTSMRGGRAAWKAFHEEFLGHGGPPIPLVRGRMLGVAPDAVF